MEACRVGNDAGLGIKRAGSLYNECAAKDPRGGLCRLRASLLPVVKSQAQNRGEAPRDAGRG